jgi:hypothetical protein
MEDFATMGLLRRRLFLVTGIAYIVLIAGGEISLLAIYSKETECCATC